MGLRSWVLSFEFEVLSFNFHMFRLVVVVLVAGLCVATVSAWGPQGHRLVALVAANHLSPVARENVAWLLDGQSLADVSTWADQYLDGNSQTALWHYVNVPEDARSYDRNRDCPRQPGAAPGSRRDRWRDCVVDRILYNQERLADQKLDRADRAIALKFLVHFIGDLHQPFHALGVERGGNGILVSVFGSPTCRFDDGSPFPCNLHSVWDSSLITRRRLNDRQYVDALERIVTSRRWETTDPSLPEAWAMESHALAKVALLPQKGAVNEAYYRAQITVVDERLARGGVRLAGWLNRALTAAPGRHEGPR